MPEYLTVGIPKTETINYDSLHAIARAHKMPSLGAFFVWLLEAQCSKELQAHKDFAKTVAFSEQELQESNESRPV